MMTMMTGCRRKGKLLQMLFCYGGVNNFVEDETTTAATMT